MFVVPIGGFFATRKIIDTNFPEITKNTKDTICGVASIILVNVILVIYAILVLTDKDNFNHEKR
jgi:hypothetical protein